MWLVFSNFRALFYWLKVAVGDEMCHDWSDWMPSDMLCESDKRLFKVLRQGVVGSASTSWVSDWEKQDLKFPFKKSLKNLCLFEKFYKDKIISKACKSISSQLSVLSQSFVVKVMMPVMILTYKWFCPYREINWNNFFKCCESRRQDIYFFENLRLIFPY